MARFLPIAALVVIALWVFAYVDLALTDRSRVRALPKPVWILVILLPVVGALLWIILGKERGSRGREARPVVAPDDDPQFLANLRREEEQEERIRRLEQELADLDDDDPKN